MSASAQQYRINSNAAWFISEGIKDTEGHYEKIVGLRNSFWIKN